MIQLIKISPLGVIPSNHFHSLRNINIPECQETLAIHQVPGHDNTDRAPPIINMVTVVTITLDQGLLQEKKRWLSFSKVSKFVVSFKSFGRYHILDTTEEH